MVDVSTPSHEYEVEPGAPNSDGLGEQEPGLSRELALERQRLDEVEQALVRQRRLIAAERKRYEQALAVAKRGPDTKKMAGVQKQVTRLERKLETIYASRTWRAGRIAWNIYHARRVLFRRPRGSDTEIKEVTNRSPVAPVSTEPGPAFGCDAADAIGYPLVENRIVREKYEMALARVGFSPPHGGLNVAVAVYTTDLSEGRGDVFTAVGLGRQLETLGYRVVYLPRDRWYDVPEGTDVYVAMLETLDPSRLPGRLTTIAWVRNQTEAWVQQSWLQSYDLVLCSSQLSLEIIEGVYSGPVGLLPLGVDTELFTMNARAEDRRGVVSTVNQWGRERELHVYLQDLVPGFPLALYGEHRGVSTQLAPYCRGPVSFFALPSLYNQATIVLDDFNHTTAGYGSVNSRIFEAAACGAVVMTNRSTGLEELGIGDLPVFDSSTELSDLIHRDLASRDALKVADDRRQLVRERHSYEVRAAEFDEHLQRLVKSDDTATDTGDTVIAYFPDYRDNPYLEMMWSDLRSRRSAPIAVGNSLDFSVPLRVAGTRPAVFHINWTAPILGGGADEHSRLVRYRRFLEALDQLHEQGMGSIWTVHNVLPHECSDLVLEAQFRQEIADRVDLVHVMCEDTVAACSGRFEIPSSKVRVLPHPSYIDVYPNLVDKQTARYELGLSHDDYVYLHFGQIRPYKGIDRLLDAFDRLARHRPRAKLLLVGSPGRFEGLAEIMQRARANPSVISNFNAVPDADVQLYLNAADVVMLPYRTALNSGALQLAYSFARPVIASEVGCVADQVDSTTGITFRWEDGRQSLLNAMLAAPDLGPEHARAAYDRAAENHYLEIGRGFSRLVEEAMEIRSQRRHA